MWTNTSILIILSNSIHIEDLFIWIYIEKTHVWFTERLYRTRTSN